MAGPFGHGAHAQGEAHKKVNMKKSMGQLLRFMKGYWVAIVSALVFAVAGTAFSIYGPNLLKQMTEKVIMGLAPGISMDLQAITIMGLWLVALYIVSSLLQFFQHFIMAKVSAGIAQQFRNQISQKINRLPLKHYDSHSYGDILSRVTNDVDTISQTLNQSLSSFITAITTVIGVIVMMFTISWELTLINMVSVPASLVAVMIIVMISQKYFRRQQSSLGEVNGHIEETFSAHTVVKVFSGEEKALERFDAINADLYRSSYKSQFLSGLMMPVMNFIGNISYVLICIVGGIMAIEQKNPVFIASIVAFIQYVKQFNQPLSQLATIATTLQSTAAASDRVFEFLELDEQENEDQKDVTVENVKGRVEFKDVCFGYDKDKEIIHHFSCVIEPGQKCAIVGPTGAGKTTMVNLLMRFYDVNSGDIFIDGVSTNDMKREEVRSLFAMVLQDTWLFEGSVKDNLRFGNPNISDEDLVRVCKAANIHHYITTLSHGYDTILTEDSMMSQGQRQLMTIARAMAQNAPMLILDEATSNVDTRTEILIQKAMDKLTEERTSFVIAHRLSTIKNADVILVMVDGNVVEKGTHDYLMKKGGFYYDLYNSQFANAGVEEE